MVSLNQSSTFQFETKTGSLHSETGLWTSGKSRKWNGFGISLHSGWFSSHLLLQCGIQFGRIPNKNMSIKPTLHPRSLVWNGTYLHTYAHTSFDKHLLHCRTYTSYIFCIVKTIIFGNSSCGCIWISQYSPSYFPPPSIPSF